MDSTPLSKATSRVSEMRFDKGFFNLGSAKGAGEELLRTNLQIREAISGTATYSKTMVSVMEKLEELSARAVAATTSEAVELQEELKGVLKIADFAVTDKRERNRVAKTAGMIRSPLSRKTTRLRRMGSAVGKGLPLAIGGLASLWGHPVAGAIGGAASWGVNKLFGSHNEKEQTEVGEMVKLLHQIQDDEKGTPNFWAEANSSLEDIAANTEKLVASSEDAGVESRVERVKPSRAGETGDGVIHKKPRGPMSADALRESVVEGGLIGGAIEWVSGLLATLLIPFRAVIWAGLKKLVVGAFDLVVDTLPELFTAGLDTLLSAADIIGAPFEAIIGFFAAAFWGLFKGVKEFIKTGSVLKGLEAAIEGFGSAIYNIIRFITFDLLPKFSTVVDWVSRKFSGAFKFIHDDIVKPVSEAISWVEKGFGLIKTVLGDLGSLLWKSTGIPFLLKEIKGGISALFHSIGTAIKAMAVSLINSLPLPDSIKGYLVNKFEGATATAAPRSANSGTPSHLSGKAKGFVSPTKALSAKQIAETYKTDSLLGLPKGTSLSQLNVESGFHAKAYDADSDGSADSGIAQINNGTLPSLQRAATAQGIVGHGPHGALDPNNIDDGLMLQRLALLQKKKMLGSHATPFKILERYNGSGAQARRYASTVLAGQKEYANLDANTSKLKTMQETRSKSNPPANSFAMTNNSVHKHQQVLTPPQPARQAIGPANQWTAGVVMAS